MEFWDDHDWTKYVEINFTLKASIIFNGVGLQGWNNLKNPDFEELDRWESEFNWGMFGVIIYY